jgi:hypothetical protein
VRCRSHTVLASVTGCSASKARFDRCQHGQLSLRDVASPTGLTRASIHAHASRRSHGVGVDPWLNTRRLYSAVVPESDTFDASGGGRMSAPTSSASVVMEKESRERVDGKEIDAEDGSDGKEGGEER